MEADFGSPRDSRQNDLFARFVHRRQVLNTGLDESRLAIDHWLEQQPQPAPISALANLEVLLKRRRDLLAELVELDDEFMLHLIEMRTQRD